MCNSSSSQFNDKHRERIHQLLHIPFFPFFQLHWKQNYKIFKTIHCGDLICEELIRWKRPWCWEWLGAGGEGDDRGWDGWMASLTQWAWVWVNSRSWWWTGRPGVLQFMGLQRVGHDWAIELNWTEYAYILWEDFFSII